MELNLIHDYLYMSKENKSIKCSLIWWWYQYNQNLVHLPQCFFSILVNGMSLNIRFASLNTSIKEKLGFCQNVSWVSARSRGKVRFESLTSFKVPPDRDSSVCLWFLLVCRSLVSSWATCAGFAFNLQPKLSLVCQSVNYASLFLKNFLVGLCTTKGRGQHFLKHNNHLSG